MHYKLRELFEWYITKKIGAEIKCCLLFFLMLCFYCVYRWICGFTEAGIVHMLEMVLLAYVLEWIQVILGSDFDEVDCLGGKEWLITVLFPGIYTLAGHFCGWFDGCVGVEIGFGIYMIVAYLCTFLIYKIKRIIDAKLLNADLKQFQARTKA